MQETDIKVLVTGATGLLGSHIVERLVLQGFQVRALARMTSNLDHLRTTGAKIVFGDIEDRSSLPAALEGVEVVFHTAARVMPGWGSWQQFEAAIVKGTENMLWAGQSRRSSSPADWPYTWAAIIELWSKLVRAKEMSYINRASLRHLNVEILMDVSRVKNQLGWEP